MPISSAIRRLTAKWDSGSGWPKRLEWVEIKGLRGWTGQRFELRYPIMAVIGENGVGKSTVLQAAASVYKSPKKSRFASDFFPDTAWEDIKDASIRFSYCEGLRKSVEGSLRKPGERWRGNPTRPERNVSYIDLTRIQPVPARVGYTKLVRSPHKEVSATLFDRYRLERFSQVMGQAYDLAKMALTTADPKRPVPVLAQHGGTTYSGFHQGAGETTVAELLEADIPKYSIVLIDELESSLHPRAQRRLIHDLTERCREGEWQIVLTTHSPYVIAELPPIARAYIMEMGAVREIIYGVSPAFAMTKMDDVPQPECDLYVEDSRAQTLLTEVLVEHAPQLVDRCQIIPYGAASVGKSLGQMVIHKRFPRPSCVFIDGDQATAIGCINIPGDDAPEVVIFETLKARNWEGISERVGRSYAVVADACSRAMAVSDHHQWVNDAASKLVLRSDVLWTAMCAEWAKKLVPQEALKLTQPIDDALIDPEPDTSATVTTTTRPLTEQRKPIRTKKPTSAIASASGQQPLFAQLSSVPED